MTLGQRLYQLRKDKNLSQEELADRLGVSRQSVSKWETDASYPEPEKLVAIAAFYHVSVDFLLRGEDAEPDREPRHGYPFFRRFHYEYKSKRTFLGLPLVHVNVGPGLCRAKGVIAVGNVATGLISVGFVAAGLLSFGVLAVGILALACLSFGIFARARSPRAGWRSEPLPWGCSPWAAWRSGFFPSAGARSRNTSPTADTRRECSPSATSLRGNTSGTWTNGLILSPCAGKFTRRSCG